MTQAASGGQAKPVLIVAVILLLAAVLRCWNLVDHGFDNIYYSPAVFSMATDWRLFFFGAFDPEGFLAIGKPPVAFWIQALCVRICGFNALAIHLPQVIAGLLSISIVFRLSRRILTVPGAAFAALLMAITPACVAADRSNLADSWLLLVLLGAAGLTLSASDTGNLKRLVMAATLVGVGFMTKLMMAYIAIPALFITYAVTAPIALRRRLVHIVLAGLVALLISLIWPIAVDLTPDASRPYIAETDDNSMLNLALGSQGLARILKRSTSLSDDHPRNPEEPDRKLPQHGGSATEPITGHGGRPGLFRLANRDMAGHITWFLPIIFFGALAAVRQKRPIQMRNRVFRDQLLWSIWGITFAAVFSLPKTFIHPYYLTQLAPAVAILTATAATVLWRQFECSRRGVIFPVVGVALTLVWHARILGFYAEWAVVFVPVLCVAGLVSVITLCLSKSHRIRKLLLCIGFATTLLCPLFWSATPSLASMGRMVPIADPALLRYRSNIATAEKQTTHLPDLIRFLQSHHQGERFILATRDIHWAAPVILKTHKAVMAFGGYYGHEEVLSVEDFEQMVSDGELRYVLVMADAPRQMRRSFREADVRNRIEDWVRNNGTLVPVAKWQMTDIVTNDLSMPMPMWGPTDHMVWMMYGDSALRLYDCRAIHE